jgi:hypothetical protein
MDFPSTLTDGCTGTVSSVAPVVASVRTTFPEGGLAVLVVLTVRLKVTLLPAASVL